MNEQQRAQVQLMMEQARDKMAREVPDEKVRDTANLLCLAKTASESLRTSLVRVAGSDIPAALAAAKAGAALVDGLISAAADLTLAHGINPKDITDAVDKLLAISAESLPRVNAYIGSVRGSANDSASPGDTVH